LLVEKMSTLAEEIIGYGNLDDLDDEEDADFLAIHKEQEKTLVEKVVAEGIRLYRTINALKKASEKLLKPACRQCRHGVCTTSGTRCDDHER
jgi:hypothetical protein